MDRLEVRKFKTRPKRICVKMYTISGNEVIGLDELFRKYYYNLPCLSCTFNLSVCVYISKNVHSNFSVSGVCSEDKIYATTSSIPEVRWFQLANRNPLVETVFCVLVPEQLGEASNGESTAPAAQPSGRGSFAPAVRKGEGTPSRKPSQRP